MGNSSLYYATPYQLSKHLAQDKRFTTVLCITLLLIIFIFWGYLPSTQAFEGNLTVSSISFTCIDPDQLLLSNLRGIKGITIKGRQTLTLGNAAGGQPFSGSQTEPRVNQLSQLRIELPDEESYLILTSPDPKAADLALLELLLQPNTKVRQLSYNSSSRLLALSLQSDHSNVLRFDPGSAALKVTLMNYRLPTLNRQDDSNPLEFNFQTTQFDLELPKQATLDIELPDSDEQPFWQDIHVQEVKFEKLLEKGDDYSKIIPNSTISAGTVRMAERTLSIEEGQFLTVQSPGIESLRRLQILHPQSSEGLELQVSGQSLKVSQPATGLKVDVSGKTALITAGLNPSLPIVRIGGNNFTRYFPNDISIALISFTSALVLSLLAWLVDNFSKANSTP